MARTYEIYLRVKSFFHEKINLISSSQRIIFFHYIDMSVLKIIKKSRQKLSPKVSLFCGKNKGMTSAISLLVRIWKISHSYPGCSFI